MDILGLHWEGGKGQRIYGCRSVGAWALEGQTVLAFRVQLSFRGLLLIQCTLLRGQGGRAGGAQVSLEPQCDHD